MLYSQENKAAKKFRELVDEYAKHIDPVLLWERLSTDEKNEIKIYCAENTWQGVKNKIAESYLLQY